MREKPKMSTPILMEMVRKRPMAAQVPCETLPGYKGRRHGEFFVSLNLAFPCCLFPF